MTCSLCGVYIGPGYCIQDYEMRTPTRAYIGFGCEEDNEVGPAQCVCAPCIESGQRLMLRMGLEVRGMNPLTFRGQVLPYLKLKQRQSGETQGHIRILEYILRKESSVSNVHVIPDEQVLKYIFTEIERSRLGIDLANAEKEKAGLVDELKAIKAQYASRAAEVVSKINLLANKVVSGYETRRVAVEKRLDLDNGIVTIVRKDTGEIIDKRPLLESERQLRLEVKTASAIETLESVKKEAPVESQPESTGEPQAESEAEAPAVSDAPGLEPGARQEDEPEPALVGGTEPDVVESLEFRASDNEGPVLDGDAQAFVDKATDLQKSVIFDPVKTRDEMIADAGGAMTPAHIAPPAPEAKPKSKRRKIG